MTALPARRRHLPTWAGVLLTLATIVPLLTLCDALGHVAWGTIRYTHPDRASLFPGQPTGDVVAGFLVIGGFCTLSGWALFRHDPPAGLPKALASTAAFAATYLLSGPFQDFPMTLYVVYLGTWALHLMAYRHQVHRLVAYCVLLGVLGPVFEGWESAMGFFTYRDVHAYHVPLWLTGLYLHGGLGTAATVSTIASWCRPAPTT